MTQNEMRRELEPTGRFFVIPKQSEVRRQVDPDAALALLSDKRRMEENRRKGER